jgi:hypothetical protein
LHIEWSGVEWREEERKGMESIPFINIVFAKCEKSCEVVDDFVIVGFWIGFVSSNFKGNLFDGSLVIVMREKMCIIGKNLRNKMPLF